jgi:hypothetical protein
MWSLPVSPRILGVVLVVLSAFAAGWYLNGLRWQKKHADEMSRMYSAGVNALKKRETDLAEQRRQNLENADAIRRRYRNSRVLVCPERDLPRADGRPDAGTSGDDRRDQVDLGPVLRDCLVTLEEVRALQVKK